MTHKSDDMCAQIVRMLGDRVTAPLGVRELALLGKSEGVPPGWVKGIGAALTEALNSAQEPADRRVIGQAIASMPTLALRGREREPDRLQELKVDEALAWLRRNLGPRWGRRDALDVMGHLEAVDRKRLRARADPPRGRERIDIAKAFLLGEKYVNHCWNCTAGIDSRTDMKCMLCRRFYRCSQCGRCLHDKPEV